MMNLVMLQPLQSKAIDIPPSAAHSHQPGKGSVYPRALRGTNSSLCLQHLPACAVWHGHSSFSSCQIPGEEHQEP